MSKFGLSINLSGDGSTLFVGNPRLGINRVGRVEIFELESGLWVAKGGPDSNDGI